MIPNQRTIFWVVGAFYPVLRLVADLYFFSVGILFHFWNNSLLFPRNFFRFAGQFLLPGMGWGEDTVIRRRRRASEEDASSRSDEATMGIYGFSARKAARLILTGEAYVLRARDVNPAVNAIASENFVAALEESEAVDEMLRNLRETEPRRIPECPLLGIPFTCKDNLLVRGLVCVAGHPRNIRNPPSDRDTEVVSRLRKAGAILLATTTLPPFGEDIETGNAVQGRCRNPHSLRRTPGGSSGGEGALISAGGSPLGLGNASAAPFAFPPLFAASSALSLLPVGLVPLNGLIADRGQVDLDHQRWTIGPMCRWAEDLSLGFGVIIGDQASAAPSSRPKLARVYYMDGLNILIAQQPTSEVLTAVHEAANLLSTTCQLAEDSPPAQKVDFPLAHHAWELWAGTRFQTPEDPIPTIWSVIKSAIPLRRLLSQTDKLRHQIASLLSPDGVLVFPAFPTVAPWHHQLKFNTYNLAYTTLFSVLGLPSVVCPVGVSREGLPLAVQLVGSPHSEALHLHSRGRALCALAEVLDDADDNRKFQFSSK